MCLNKITTVAISLLLLLIMNHAAWSAEPIRIGLLKDTSVFWGCGCAISPVSSRGKVIAGQYIFSEDSDGQAYINIDGREMVLREVGRKQAEGEGGYCAGKKCTYSASDITATVDYRKTEGCPPEPTECEVTDYDVTITVEKGSRKQRVKGKGSCGC